MIEKISCYLVQLLEATGYYQKIWGLAELLEKDGQTFPVIYEMNGQYTPIRFEFDGTSWFRVGEVTMDEDDELQDISCNEVINISYPFILAGAMPRKKDSPFYIHKVVEDHMGVLTGMDAELRRDLQAVGLDIELSGYQMNLDSEFEEIDLSHKYGYFTLNFTVSVKMRKDCIVPCPA